MKLDKVYYLSPTVILVNVIHYYNLKMRLKISALLMTSCPCHSHSFQRKENKWRTKKQGKLKHTWHAHRQEWYDSNMLVSMLTHKFIREMNIGFYLSSCHVWLWGTLYQCYFGLIADSSVIHYACEEWSPRDIIFSVWLHEYTKRLGFLCASNQTINVSLPCLDYIQAISICGVLDSYQCLPFEFRYKKMCDSVNGVVPSIRHSNLANCNVRIITLLMWWWINVTSAGKIKIQLN